MVVLPGFHQIDQPREAPAMGEPQVVEGGAAVKVEKFIINGNLLVALVPLGNQPGDPGFDGNGAQVFENADPLVALLNKVAIEIFIDLDGLPDALADVGFIELAPLCAKLRVLGQKGHEIPCKGVAAGGGPGAENLIDGNLGCAQVDFTADFNVVQQVVEVI